MLKGARDDVGNSYIGEKQRQMIEVEREVANRISAEIIAKDGRLM